MPGIRHLVCLTLATGLLLMHASAVRSTDFDGLVKVCEGCHGQDGNSRLPLIPSIAGYSYERFLEMINVYRENDRIAEAFQHPGEPVTVMTVIASGLSDADANALAKYFSARTFLPVRQPVDSNLAKRGAILHEERCKRCHTRNGAEPVGDTAILAGQWTPYLRQQIENIASGKRIALASMRRRLKKLSQNEIEALLNFYASAGMQ